MKPGTVVYRDEDGWPETGTVLPPAYQLKPGRVLVAWDPPCSKRYRGSVELVDRLLIWPIGVAT